MNYNNNSIITKLFKIISKYFLRKTLVIFLGKHSIKLTALQNNTILTSLDVELKDKKSVEEYKAFLESYKYYQVVILLDSKDSVLHHEIIPMLQSLVGINAVSKFISENYENEEIIAYNIYNTKYDNGEIQEMLIASCKYNPPLSLLLEYIIQGPFNFQGVYFLSLEMSNIMDSLIAIGKANEYLDQLQILITITKSSDIIIAVKHKNNIMDHLTVEYNSNKSDEYILGCVEQAISDRLLLYKNYISHLDLKVVLIFLCDRKMAQLYSTMNVACHKVILTDENLNNKSVGEDERFQDNNLIRLFNQSKKFLGVNLYLQSITKLSRINSIIFKPVVVIIFGLLIAIGTLKYNSYNLNLKARELNSEYYQISEAYRNIQKLNPNAEKEEALEDLYNLKSIIEKGVISPFWSVKYLLGMVSERFVINQVSWRVRDKELLLSTVALGPIIFDLQIDAKIYSKSIQGITHVQDDIMPVIDGYINHIKFLFAGSKIKYNIDSSNMIKLQNQIVIPIKVTVSGTMEGN